MNDREEHRWIVLYRTALLELDAVKLAERIREAREAIREKLEGASRNGGTISLEERGLLEDALHNLRALEDMET
jgi:hypothetical protein